MHVILHRLFGEIQLRGNFFVGETAANELYQLLFAASEPEIVLEAETESVRSLGRNVLEQGEAKIRRAHGLIAGDGANGASHLDGRSVFKYVTGHPIPVEELPRRPGDPAVLIAGSAKIESELGWKPKYTHLDDIVRSAWEWHQHRYEAK